MTFLCALSWIKMHVSLRVYSCQQIYFETRFLFLLSLWFSAHSCFDGVSISWTAERSEALLFLSIYDYRYQFRPPSIICYTSKNFYFSDFLNCIYETCVHCHVSICVYGNLCTCQHVVVHVLIYFLGIGARYQVIWARIWEPKNESWAWGIQDRGNSLEESAGYNTKTWREKSAIRATGY